MGLKELSRVIFPSYAVCLLFSLLLWGFWDGSHAVGLAFGGIWSTTNLLVLKWLLTEIFSQQRNVLKVFIAAQIKIPVLYGLGVLVLLYVPLSIGAAIVGFHIPFLLVLAGAVRTRNREMKAARMAGNSTGETFKGM